MGFSGRGRLRWPFITTIRYRIIAPRCAPRRRACLTPLARIHERVRRDHGRPSLFPRLKARSTPSGPHSSRNVPIRMLKRKTRDREMMHWSKCSSSANSNASSSSSASRHDARSPECTPSQDGQGLPTRGRYFVPSEASRAARNSFPARHSGHLVAPATRYPIVKSSLRSPMAPDMSQSGLISSDGLW